MRKISYYMTLLFTLVAFAACDTEKDIPQNPLEASGKVTFQGTIGEMNTTRATGTKWDNGDAIGVYALKKGESLPAGIYDGKQNVKYTTPGNGTFTAAGEGIAFPDEGTLDFIAYYPYQANLSNQTFNIDVSNQSNPAAIDLLYSNNAKDKGKSNAAIDLQFKHMLSMLVINVTAGDGLTSLDGLTTTIAGLNTKGTFNLANGEVAISNTSGTLTPTQSLSGKSATIAAILVPGQNISQAKIAFKVGGKNYEWQPQSQDLQSGKRYTYKVQLTTTGVVLLNPGATIIDWEDVNTGTGDIILTPDEETPPPSEFKTDKTNVSFAATGTLTSVVKLTAENDQAWTAQSNQSWLTATASGTGSGDITLTADANTTTAERTATLTITATGAAGVAPIAITVTQAAGNPQPTSNLVFPGADFEDWNAFLGSLNSFGLKSSYTTQSKTGGRNNSAALHINGTPTANEYVFTNLISSGYSLAGKSKIVLYIKGTATKSLSFNVYVGKNTVMGTDYLCYNLENATDDKVLTPTKSNAYIGTIDTGNKWIKVTLDISGLTPNKDTGDNIFALKVGKDAVYDLYIDDITVE